MSRFISFFCKEKSLVNRAFFVLIFTVAHSNCLIAADIVEGRIEIASSFNPVGSGARALGMGGAFISIADDATAASWNPGALIQIRNPELSIVGGYFNRTESIDFGEIPEAAGDQEVNHPSLNYFSASYPCSKDICGRNMVFSVNYQNLYNFEKDWHFGFDGKGPGNSISSQSIDFEQTGDLYALGLAFAIEVYHGLSLGITFNYWGDTLFKNEWEQNYNVRNKSTFSFNGTSVSSVSNSLRKEHFSFNGFNMNIGLLWELYQKDEQKLTLGLVFKTPFTADIKHNTEGIDKFSNNGGVIQTDITNISRNEEMELPMSFGIGLSYQFSDNFTLAGDVYRTSWDDFIRIDSNGNKLSAISNLPIKQSKVEATYQVRLGGEYRIISQKFGENYIIPLRAGIFYDPAASEEGADNFYGLSLGSGIAYERYVFDIAYQFRFAKKVGEYILPKQQFSEDVYEHTVYASLSLRL